MTRKIGDRVGAICGQKDDGRSVLVFGYGVYVGEEVPGPEIEGPVGISLHEYGTKNPKILLDSGEVIWGCECWWGSEDSIKKALEEWISEGKTIEVISPEEYRRKTF